MRYIRLFLFATLLLVNLLRLPALGSEADRLFKAVVVKDSIYIKDRSNTFYIIPLVPGTESRQYRLQLAELKYVPPMWDVDSDSLYVTSILAKDIIDPFPCVLQVPLSQLNGTAKILDVEKLTSTITFCNQLSLANDTVGLFSENIVYPLSADMYAQDSSIRMALYQGGYLTIWDAVAKVSSAAADFIPYTTRYAKVDIPHPYVSFSDLKSTYCISIDGKETVIDDTSLSKRLSRTLSQETTDPTQRKQNFSLVVIDKGKESSHWLRLSLAKDGFSIDPDKGSHHLEDQKRAELIRSRLNDFATKTKFYDEYASQIADIDRREQQERAANPGIPVPNNAPLTPTDNAPTIVKDPIDGNEERIWSRPDFTKPAIGWGPFVDHSKVTTQPQLDALHDLLPGEKLPPATKIDRYEWKFAKWEKATSWNIMTLWTQEFESRDVNPVTLKVLDMSYDDEASILTALYQRDNAVYANVIHAGNQDKPDIVSAAAARLPLVGYETEASSAKITGTVAKNSLRIELDYGDNKPIAFTLLNGRWVRAVK